MAKNKIYDNSLINTVRQESQLYDSYLAPRTDVSEYLHYMQNPSVDIAPDDYGFLDHISNAYYNWQRNRNTTLKDTALGDYVRIDQDINILKDAANYIAAFNDYNNALNNLLKDPYNKDIADSVDEAKDRMKQYSEGYNMLRKNEMNDDKLNNKLNLLLDNEDYNSFISIANKEINPIDGVVDPNTLYGRKDEALTAADQYQTKIDEYDSKITSNYYRRKSEEPGMDLSDIDTYLYKLPGLMGSSAATLEETLATTAGAWAAGAVGGSIGGPVGSIVGAVGAGTIAIIGNLYSRDQESKAEVYNYYKQSVQNALSKQSKTILKDAKAKMKEQGYTKDQINDDDFVWDRILTRDIKVDNIALNKAMTNNDGQLKALYERNMALSASDVIQTGLEIVPLGKLGKLASPITKAGRFGKILGKSTESLRGIRKQLSDRIDDVTAFGIENVGKLPKLTRRKAVRDLGGRILLSSALEGGEEGAQYIFGEKLLNKELDIDANIAENIVSTYFNLGRAIIAGLTPFDSAYSSDEEFMENFKGGALLGGISTGVIGGITTARETSLQTKVDKVLSDIYSDKYDQQDRIRKNILYSKAIKNNNWDRIEQSFDNLESLNIDGIDIQDIKDERKRANLIKNTATSKQTLMLANQLGIDPRTDDYDVLVGLLDHQEQLVSDAISNRNNARATVEELMYNQNIDLYINNIKPNATVDETMQLRQLIFDKAYYDAILKLDDYLKSKTEAQSEIEKNLKYATNKSDLIKLKSILNVNDKFNKENESNIQDRAKELGITVEQLEVPQMHQDITNAEYEFAISELLVSKANEENKLMLTKKGALEKINRYKELQQIDDEYVQNLNDFYSGKQQEKAEQEGEVVTQPEVAKEEIKPTATEQTATKQKTEQVDELQQLRDQLNENKNKLFTEIETIKYNKRSKKYYKVKEKKIRQDSIAGKAQKDAEDVLKKAYLTVFPEEKEDQYDEYSASSEIENNQNADENILGLWQDVYDKKQQLEEAFFNSKDITSDEELNNIRSLTEDLNRVSEQLRTSIVDNNQNNQEQNVQEEIKQQVDKKEQNSPTVQNIKQNDSKPVLPTEEQPKQEPQKAVETPTLSEILGDLVGEEAANAMNTVTQSASTEQELPKLNYNQKSDPYSHQLSYRLTQQQTDGSWTNIKYQGMDKYLNNDDLARVICEPDFINEASKNAYFVVRPYNNPNGNVEDAIYMIIPYKGKEYVAAVSTANRIDYLANKRFNPDRRSYNEWQAIKQNLQDLRNKIIELDKQSKKIPNSKVVPTMLHRTTGQFFNEKNQDNSPKNRKLTDSIWLTEKDPYKIDAYNTQIGITTGPRSNRIVRFGSRVMSGRGYSLGQPMLEVQVPRTDGGNDTKLIKLNIKKFAEEPEIADLILKLLLSNDPYFTDANGVKTNIETKHLLDFIVNIGPQTEFNPSDFDQAQAAEMQKKVFYIEQNGDIIMGDNRFTVNDLLSNKELYDKAKQYIIDNYHYSVDEESLLKLQLGGDNTVQNQDGRFSSVRAFMRNNNLDKIVMIPNKFEFTLKDFGLKRNDKNEIIPDGTNGISELGWYIKQGILLTDVSDKLWNANLYVDDVQLITEDQQKVLEQVNTAKPEQDTNKGFQVMDQNGVVHTVDITETLKMMDAANRKGPNMEVSETELKDLQKNKEYRMNIDEAISWLSDTLGITPEIIDGVVDVTESGGSVIGRVTEDSILLSNVATEDIVYHEAWHRVSQLLIDDKRRKKIYQRFNKKSGENKSEKEIDEILADSFKDFMINDAKTFDFETNNWFKRIYDFIRLWVRTGSYGLAKIYSQINRGKFSGIKPNQKNIERFRKIYSGKGPNYEVNGYKFQNIQKQKQFDDICKSLLYAFFNVSFSDGHSINYADLKEEKPTFERLKLIVQAQANKFPNPVIQEIYDNFDNIFAKEIAIRLKNLGIRAIDRNEEDTISNIEEGAQSVDIGQHTVEGMNISIKDNAPAEVKFFIQTIPDYYLGKDGIAKTKQDPYTNFPMFVDSNIAWTKVLKDLHNCRTISQILVKANSLAQNGDLFYKSFVFKLQQEIQKSINGSANSEALLTKIETVLTGDINNFVTVAINEDNETGLRKIEIKDNTVDIKAAIYPRVWSQYLFVSSGLFHYNKDGKVETTDNAKNGINRIIKSLKSIKTAFVQNRGELVLGSNKIDLHIPGNQDWLKSQLVNILNTIGIGIDIPTINNMLRSGDYGNPAADQYTLLNSFINSRVHFGGMDSIITTLESILKSIAKDNTIDQISLYDKTFKPSEVWNNNGFAKELANNYAEVHATDSSLSSIGPDGNSYYMVSQNNFAKDRVNELVNDKEVRDQLRSVVYNQNSILLRAAEQGANLKVETFINFKDNTSTYDAGRDYFGITDREDYLAKMSFVQKDKIIFPTVADKKTYHMISGVKLPHERIQFTPAENGKYYITFGDQTIDTILGYCEDELNQIELCLRQIDDDPNHVKDGIHYNEDGTINNDWLPKERRVKNFHTPNSYKYKDKNGVEKTVTLEGNGARFLFLTGIYTSNGFINFNDPTKSAKENLKTAKEYFFNLSRETKKAFLSGILATRVKEEIQYCIDNGIITANDQSNIWSLRNNLLDDSVLTDRWGHYKNFDSVNAEGFAIYDMIADYTVNSIISIQEIEKLFSGSPAYYKVKYDRQGITDISVDKIKRLGSLTSTGLNNRLDFFNAPLESDEYSVAELKDHEVKSRQYQVYKDLFFDGNLKETVIQMYGESAWNEVKDLSKEEIKEKYPEAYKYANMATNREVEGYESEINVADAAVYISPKMTENLLRMRGVWSDDIKKAFDILTNPDTADKWESDKELYAKANKVILNAMKYVAFGTRFDVPGLGVPYFNKMALFPLFKSVATGDIKLLYDKMIDPDPAKRVDMFMFNSAVKAGSVNPTKMYRDASDSEIELKDGQTVLSAEMMDRIEAGYKTLNSLDNITIYKQKYKYIRQQLETNPHTHEEQMLGTQFMKVNLSNLRLNDLYGKEGDKIKGSQIKDNIIGAINKLSDLGRQDIYDKLFDKDGNIKITALSDMLLQDARESGANDNVISGLATKDDAFVIPLSALSDNKWLESRFISMINKEIVDVHLPGGAFIQRSVFGQEATSLDVVTPNMLGDGRYLKPINDKDGSMDSIVSINLFKYIIPNYDKMTFIEARQWLLDHNIIGENAEASAIGYRIPTQSIASISALRFVDVFPEIMGDTIMLPEDFTKLTGSDFDIDKLYVARYSYKDGKIIQHGDALTNEDVKSAYKNQLMQNYLRVLLTKENTNQLKLSIDIPTDNVKAVLKDIESGRQKTYATPFGVYTPSYQEARKSEYTVGKSGIGPFALNNAHHILTQLTGLKMVSNEFTEALRINDVSRVFDYPTALQPKGGRILDWLSAMINGFVDIAKDPYITRLNVNAWTYNMVAFLLRTGKGKQTFYFMSQPILKEMADAVLKTKGKYGIDKTKTPSQLEKEAIDSVLKKYDPDGTFQKKYDKVNSDNKLAAQVYQDIFKTYTKEVDGETIETSTTRELLFADKNDLEPLEDGISYNEHQIRMYYAYKMIKPYADALANLVKYSKIDTKKTGKSFAEQLVYYNGMLAMKDDEHFAPGSIEKFFNETFIQRKTDNAIPFGISIFRNLLLRNTDSFISQQNEILKLLGRQNNADKKLLNSVISGMEGQIKAEFFNKYIQNNNIDVLGMFTGGMSMAKRINNFQQLIKKKNPRLVHLLNDDGTFANDFISYLVPNISDGKINNGLDFIDTSKLLDTDQATANNLINYWRELIDDPDPQISKLFKDLVVYAFLTSADNPGMNTFFQFVPNSYRIQIGYTDYIGNVLSQLSNTSNDYISSKEDIFLNGWINDKLVRPVDYYDSNENKLLSISFTKENKDVPNMVAGIRFGKSKSSIRPLNWAKINGNSYPIFPPYIKMSDRQGYGIANYHVYKLVGYIQKYNEYGKIEYIPLYGLVSKKGYKYRGHQIYEYGTSTRFDFNKENEYNYTEALDNQESLIDMVDEFEKDQWNNLVFGTNSSIHQLSDLPSYNGDFNQLQDIVYQEDEDSIDESDYGILESKDEPDKTSNQYNTFSNARRTYSGMITNLQPNQIFVFGSNTQGRHGAGAARVARDNFGAIYGQAEGIQGQSYAIITKDLTKDDKVNPSRTKEQITEQIHKLYEYARQNPDKEFLVAYSASGRNLNHYSNQDMANMFASEIIPNNIVFEKDFNDLINQAYELYANEFNRITQMEVDAIQKMRSYLTDLSKDMVIDSDQIDTKLNEFIQLIREENPSTNEEMEGLINKFICDL